jgi:hypothetical protein
MTDSSSHSAANHVEGLDVACRSGMPADYLSLEQNGVAVGRQEEHEIPVPEAQSTSSAERLAR